jgi:hypothetical protein
MVNRGIIGRELLVLEDGIMSSRHHSHYIGFVRCQLIGSVPESTLDRMFVKLLKVHVLVPCVRLKRHEIEYGCDFINSLAHLPLPWIHLI